LWYHILMSWSPTTEHDVVSFAERVIELLERTSVVATYKYAVIIALMDLCMEQAGKKDGPGEIFTTRQVAEKVLELYWPHSRVFPASSNHVILKQNTGRQARILTDIIAFRRSLPDGSVSLHRARLEAPTAYTRLLNRIEWTLILMPLPRLQTVGGQKEEILYSITWDTRIERAKRTVSAYQRGASSEFDNCIRLKPGVSAHLVKLNGLLRPLVYRNWTSMVARINHNLFQEATLEEFLFGRDRITLAPVVPALREIQNNVCFYCAKPIGKNLEVDHFLPWSRYPDNGIENLVAVHRQCNQKKRDFLAAGHHVERWTSRLTAQSSIRRQLEQVARERRWETHGEQTVGAARSIYLNLHSDARLWDYGNLFVPADLAQLRTVLNESRFVSRL